jgi:hypothetical protein
LGTVEALEVLAKGVVRIGELRPRTAHGAAMELLGGRQQQQ